MGVGAALVVGLALSAGAGWLPAEHGLGSTAFLATAAPTRGPSQEQAAGEVIVEIRFRGNYSIADQDLLTASGAQIGGPLTPAILADIERRLRDYQGVGSVEILKRYRSMTNVEEVVLLVNITEHVGVSEKFMFLPVFTWTDEYGVTFDGRGAKVVEVAEVGRDNIHVHNPADPNPSVAFALSRLSHGPYGPTPLGIFRKVPTPSYGRLLEHQIAEARNHKGPGDLAKVIRSRGTWMAK